MVSYTGVVIVHGDFSEDEINQYIEHVEQSNGGRGIKWISFDEDVTDDGSFVNIRYELEPVRFERIRRITGYLVGSLDRFNDAKRSEVDDRVNHSAEQT